MSREPPNQLECTYFNSTGFSPLAKRGFLGSLMNSAVPAEASAALPINQ